MTEEQLNTLRACKWLMHRQAKLILPGLKEFKFEDTKQIDAALASMLKEFDK